MVHLEKEVDIMIHQYKEMEVEAVGILEVVQALFSICLVVVVALLSFLGIMLLT